MNILSSVFSWRSLFLRGRKVHVLGDRYNLVNLWHRSSSSAFLHSFLNSLLRQLLPIDTYRTGSLGQGVVLLYSSEKWLVKGGLCTCTHEMLFSPQNNEQFHKYNEIELQQSITSIYNSSTIQVPLDVESPPYILLLRRRLCLPRSSIALEVCPLSLEQFFLQIFPSVKHRLAPL